MRSCSSCWVSTSKRRRASVWASPRSSSGMSSLRNVLPSGGSIVDRLHLDQVDDAAERRRTVLGRAAADGNGDGNRVCLRAVRVTSSTALAKLAPTTSILLTKTRRGT